MFTWIGHSFKTRRSTWGTGNLVHPQQVAEADVDLEAGIGAGPVLRFSGGGCWAAAAAASSALRCIGAACHSLQSAR
jgi:hypothetical protein